MGVVKELPPAEMEKLIRTHIETTDNDLRKLAASRTVKVKEQLLATGEIDSGRIFIVEAQSAPAKKEKVKESRVEFKIK